MKPTTFDTFVLPSNERAWQWRELFLYS
jgi:hypothetical protein